VLAHRRRHPAGDQHVGRTGHASWHWTPIATSGSLAVAGV
jgi:hypothetical protein